jgi:multiple sugar transport system substrate-binding protein
MYIKSQVLEPLDKYIKMSGTKMNDIVAESIKPYKDNRGTIYALPYDWCPLMTCYNRTHLKAAGIGDLTEKFTFDDLKNIAYKLRVTNGTKITKWGLTTGYGGWPFEGMWLKPFGGKIYNDDETQLLITSKESVKGLDYAQRLFSENLVGGAFPKTASLTFYGTWEFKNLVKVKEDWDIAPMPKGPADYAGSAMGSGYSIARNSKHKTEAWTFINELMGPRGMELVWSKGTTPSRKSGLKSFYENYPKVSTKYVDVALDNSWAGRPMMPPGEMATNAIIDPILSKLQTLKISPEQAAQNIKSGVEALWKSKRRKK